MEDYLSLTYYDIKISKLIDDIIYQHLFEKCCYDTLSDILCVSSPTIDNF